MVTSPNLSNESDGPPTPDEILQEASQTYRDKNLEYKDNFRSFPQVMIALFPDGLAIKSYEDWMRLQFFMLNVVKMTRYAQNFGTGGHKDSVRDITVYSAMLEAIDAEFSYFRTDRKPLATT